MKAFQVTAQADGAVIRPLAFPTVYRKGDVPAEPYRRQASGEIPPLNLNLSPLRFFRTIIVKEGSFAGFASESSGALLTIVNSGGLTLSVRGGPATQLTAGDVLLVDAESASRIAVTAHGECRLTQAGVAADWPGPDAKLQAPGTVRPRDAGKVNIKRVYKGKDDLAYFSEFPELFPAPVNQWSAPRAAVGFRFMCWEDGMLDWHPEVVNNFGTVLSGELELETGDGRIEVFHAGDICMAEDRTGKGHIDRARGMVHVFLIVVDTKDLW